MHNNWNLAGKTVKRVLTHFNKQDCCTDLGLEFTDGSFAQLGASEDCLICVIAPNVKAEPSCQQPKSMNNPQLNRWRDWLQRFVRRIINYIILVFTPVYHPKYKERFKAVKNCLPTETKSWL